MKATLYALMTFLFGVAINAQADLIVINNTGNTISAYNFLNKVGVMDKNMIMQNLYAQKNTLNNVHSIDMNVVGYPDHSIFTPGKVTQHKIKDGYFHSIPIFVIGNDRYSIHWGKTNSQYLKKIHAIGIITNIDSENEKKQIENKIGISLIPSNLDGLEKIINTTHYPFLIENGVVYQ